MRLLLLLSLLLSLLLLLLLLLLLTVANCVETKLCKPYTSFTSKPNSLSGMMWYSTLRVKYWYTRLAAVFYLTNSNPNF